MDLKLNGFDNFYKYTKLNDTLINYTNLFQYYIFKNIDFTNYKFPFYSPTFFISNFKYLYKIIKNRKNFVGNINKNNSLNFYNNIDTFSDKELKLPKFVINYELYSHI